jgi:hypothetical protein
MTLFSWNWDASFEAFGKLMLAWLPWPQWKSQRLEKAIIPSDLAYLCTLWPSCMGLELRLHPVWHHLPTSWSCRHKLRLLVGHYAEWNVAICQERRLYGFWTSFPTTHKEPRKGLAFWDLFCFEKCLVVIPEWYVPQYGGDAAIRCGAPL